MFASYAARVRHSRLARLAYNLVFNADTNHGRSASDVTPGQLILLAFREHRYEVPMSEARKYLAAALVRRNHPYSHLFPASCTCEETAA